MFPIIRKIVNTPFFCFENSKFCAPGKYSPAKGLSVHSDCLLCSQGTYGTELGCNNYVGDPAIDDTVTTSAGTTLAPLRSCSFSCAQCDKGTWSAATGATSASTCQKCVEGKYLVSILVFLDPMLLLLSII